MPPSSVSFVHTIACTKCGHSSPKKSVVPPSPTPHLVESNAAPSYEECRAIEKCIALTRPQFAFLDQAILHFSSLLRQPHIQRQNLEDYVDAHMAVRRNLTPARRVLRKLGLEKHLNVGVRKTGTLDLPRGLTLREDSSTVSLNPSVQSDSNVSAEWFEMTTFDDACSHCGFVYQLTEYDVAPPPTPIPNLLGTEGIPSDAESRSIKDVVAGVRQTIHRIDKDIKRIEALLRQLHDERRGLLHFIAQHEVLFSPARRLHPELWSEIFLFCLEDVVMDDPFDFIPDTFDPKGIPFLLTHVCASWREIALSTQQLWTVIGLRVKPERPRTQPILVKHWLDRSGARPLTVYIKGYEPTSATRSPVDWKAQRALQAVLLQSTRWKVAYLRIPPATGAWECFSCIQGNLPILKTLSVLSTRPPIWRPAFITKVFDTVPMLEDLTLDHHLTFDTTIPYTNLTSLRLRTDTFNSLLDALRLIPSLQKCFIHFDKLHEDFPPGASSTIICHTSLRLLHLTPTSPLVNLFPGEMTEQLDRITLPSLEHLELHSSESFCSWDEHSLCTFLKRSMCTLQHLTFTCPAFSPRAMTAFLSSISMSVTRLHLDIKDGWNFVDHTLFSPTYLHRLQVFELHFAGSSIPLPFADFFRSRTPDVTGVSSELTRVLLGLKDAQQLRITASQLDDLDRWARGGLRTQIFLVDPTHPWAAPTGNAVCFDSAKGGPVFGRFKLV